MSRGVFRAPWTLLNAVGILTKSISGFELWRFEFSVLGLLWANIYRVTWSSSSRFFFHVYLADPALTSASLNKIGIPQFEQIEFKLPGKVHFLTSRFYYKSTPLPWAQPKRLQIGPLLKGTSPPSDRVSTNRKPGSGNWLHMFPP